MNSKSILISFVAGLAGALLTVAGFSFVKKKDSAEKTAYIVTQEVFESFDATKEVKKKLIKMEERQKLILDSMALEINLMEKKSGSENGRVLASKNRYNTIYANLTASYQGETKKYNDGLWKQINQYIGEYGKENNYKYIYGANGNGNLMFAAEQNNITKEVTAFINKKYAE